MGSPISSRIMHRLHPSILSFAIAIFAAANASAQSIADRFKPSDSWKTASEISLADSGTSFTAVESEDGEILYTDGEAADGNGNLESHATFSDQVVSFDYLVPEGSQAAVILQGRYEVLLASSQGQAVDEHTAGAIAGGFNNNTGHPFEAQLPSSNAALSAGEWNSITLRFRTLRNDEAFNKLSNSLFLDITLNGEVVQQDTQIPYYTSNSSFQWEQTDGPLIFRATSGPIAIRNLTLDHANYDAVTIFEPSQPTNASELVDQVEIGQQAFTSLGCIECHTTKKGDTSFKTGPNVFGLFQRTPRKREIVEPATDARFQVDADFSYAKRSIRQPAAELSIAETGPNQGQPYLPVMAPYSEEILDDSKLDAIYRYLVTLNDAPQRGPVQVLVPAGGPESYDPLEDTMEVLVFDRTRIQRGSMSDVSGRSIHVGFPTGVNYTFDPRTLSIEKLWQGGFVNGAGEWENRGGGGFKLGYESKEVDFANAGGLLAPLDDEGQGIDFSFKEAIFHDWKTIEASMTSEVDHLDQLAAIDAQFLGYTLDSSNDAASPIFHYRIGENEIQLQAVIEKDGASSFKLTGSLATSQSFSVNQNVLTQAQVSSGQLADGTWTIDATENLQATLSAKIGLASLVWRPEPTDTEYLSQPLKIEDTDADLPAGYRSEQYVQPHDNIGRDLLFEATGIDVAPDGTIVVGTRTSGIWRIVDGEWQLFAEGLFDCLGLVVEDESGLQIVAGQKPELTRITDTNGDGIADTFETLSDQFSYHSNYHAYMHGPSRDADENYYYLLNLLHTDEAIYKGEGLYMGSSGGYSGWAIKVTPDGDFIPWANGLRSPAGLGIDSSNTIWYAENQGEYVGTSKLFVLEADKFYGNPVGLIDLPGMQPDSPEIQWPEIGETREKAVALFPHNIVANSPGHMTWDTTGGKFGPFKGQMFIGDQTQSKLYRVTTYEVGGQLRGAVFPFGADLQSGLMRPVFLSDGSLLIGQTGRGWHAKGGKIASLQRIVWDGETVAPAFEAAAAGPEPTTEITLTLTQAFGSGVTVAQIQEKLSVASWMYRDAPDYGSPELDRIQHETTRIEIDETRKTLKLQLAGAERENHPFRTSRVYHVVLESGSLFPENAPETLEAFITGE